MLACFAIRSFVDQDRMPAESITKAESKSEQEVSRNRDDIKENDIK